MAKKSEPKIEKIEREYVIPLRDKCRPVPIYRKTPKAVKTIKEFIVRHMKIRDRDLRKVKIDNYLNETLWFRGIKRPPHKIKVKAIQEGDIVRVEAVDLYNNLKFKKLREERKALAALAATKKKKVVEEVDTKQNTESSAEPTEEEKKEEERKTTERQEGKPSSSSAKDDERKKAAAGAEATQQIGKAQAKQLKQKQPSMKQPKRPQRKSLAK